MSEQILCIIPALNEANSIGRTLASLDKDLVEPLVVVNGSSDATEPVVRSYGLTPLVLPEAGKLPAIQEGLRYIGRRALDPILLTDADSVPRYPHLWPNVMVAALDPEGASVVAGRSGIIDAHPLVTFVRNFRLRQVAHETASTDEMMPVGYNMAIRLSDEKVLESVLALPHVWPGEDRLLAETIVNAGGNGRQLASKESTVLASARYHTSLLYRVLHGRQSAVDLAEEGYKTRRASSAEFSYWGGVLEPYATVRKVVT
ncbi:MAG TPA: glycosyltransferase family A protein [Candidatus Saccharimonadales bacterium]|nr:glycosyltransferase family A protein [Candidatus Saccharimonadales bacterium]